MTPTAQEKHTMTEPTQSNDTTASTRRTLLAGTIAFTGLLLLSAPVGIAAVVTDIFALVVGYFVIIGLTMGAMIASIVYALRTDDVGARTNVREVTVMIGVTTPCCDRTLVRRAVRGGRVDPFWPIAFNELNGVLQCHSCGAIYVPEPELTGDEVDLESGEGSPGYMLWKRHGGGLDERDFHVRLGKLKQKNEEGRGE